jgi:hypothetical protein
MVVPRGFDSRCFTYVVRYGMHCTRPGPGSISLSAFSLFSLGTYTCSATLCTTTISKPNNRHYLPTRRVHETCVGTLKAQNSSHQGDTDPGSGRMGESRVLSQPSDGPCSCSALLRTRRDAILRLLLKKLQMPLSYILCSMALPESFSAVEAQFPRNAQCEGKLKMASHAIIEADKGYIQYLPVSGAEDIIPLGGRSMHVCSRYARIYANEQLKAAGQTRRRTAGSPSRQ